MCMYGLGMKMWEIKAVLDLSIFSEVAEVLVTG